MDTKIDSSLKKLKSSVEFREYHKSYPDCYLASCFKMGDSKINDVSWQFDFYSLRSRKMTSFQIGETIKVQKDQDVFSQGKPPKELELNKVKIDFDKAISLVNKVKKKRIPDESINKEIIILQAIDGKAVWNITLLTSAFNVMNIRINANSGEIISENNESILKFKTSQ